MTKGDQMRKLTLSEFAERVHGMLWADGWHDLDEIADRLDEELSELDRMRCAGEVDRVNNEDYAAAMWVRELGGLDAVKERFERVETWDADKAALWDLCADKAAFWDLRAECGGIDGVRARMMPEGVSWPRFEDGEHVRLGDCYEKSNGNPGTVTTMQLRLCGDVPTWIIGKGKGKVSVKPGERVKRPAPKVLDADGEEIREGDTVWDIESGIEYEVVGIHTDEDSPVRVMRTDGSHLAKAAKPSTLTHKRPDSWDRLMDDATQHPWYYCRQHGVETDAVSPDADLAEVVTPFAHDLVRRAKALAERGA